MSGWINRLVKGIFAHPQPWMGSSDVDKTLDEFVAAFKKEFLLGFLKSLPSTPMETPLMFAN
jgi:hypothetical protein